MKGGEKLSNAVPENKSKPSLDLCHWKPFLSAAIEGMHVVLFATN